MVIADEQQCLSEEAQFNLPTPKISVAESESDVENYGGVVTQKNRQGP